MRIIIEGIKRIRPVWRYLSLFLVFGLITGVCCCWWLWWNDRPSPAARETAARFLEGVRRGEPFDVARAAALNNKGVGEMERFDYEAAVGTFEEVVKLAPAWLPGRVNLGIALLNAGGTADEAILGRTREVFEGVLRLDPDNPHAHHCLGVLLMYQKDPGDAVRHFEAVTRIDPNDASAWFFLGTLTEDRQKRQEYFRTALRRDPYHIGALYQVGLQQGNKDVLDVFAALKEAEWGNPSAVKYSEMGRYGEVIGSRPERRQAAQTGPLPAFGSRLLKVKLADGSRWATPADLGERQRRVRDRFGGRVAVLDYDGDGRPDLFLIAAVVDEDGRVRDLLLRNTPDEEGRLLDVTREAGLLHTLPTLGCAVADVDNDGRPDLVLCGAGGVRVFRNAGKGGQFEDVTAPAGLGMLDGVYLTCALADLDQDGDLDLLLAAEDEVPVYLHVGEAPAGKSALECKYRRTDLGGLDLRGLPSGFVVTDLDGDRDVDLIVLFDDRPPAVLANDRLLRFRRLEVRGVSRDAKAERAGTDAAGRAPPPVAARQRGTQGALILDIDHSERSALFFASSSPTPSLLLNRCRPGLAAQQDVRLDPGAVKSPPLLAAAVADVDLDGWPDVVGLSADRKTVVVLHNDGAGRLVHRPDALTGCAVPPEVEAVVPIVFDPSARLAPGLLVWAKKGGLTLIEPGKAMANHGLLVSLTGRRGVDRAGSPMRCNADAVGARVIAQAATHWTAQENGTLFAGLAQSRPPLLLGLGRHRAADVVRLRWPDGTIQAELSLSGRAKVAQTNRKRTSCPVVFAWDGERFRFVNDFLGAGSLGELLPDGSTRPPRGEESLKIEPAQLAPREGRYVLRFAEPMDEIAYLDHLRLAVIDHPATVRVYPDERFATGGPAPTQNLITFERQTFPVRARDHRGQDVTAPLKEWDRATADGFAKRSWLGFAEEHWVELDFGDRLASLGAKERAFLCLAGWTDYPYPEAIWAARQAGVAMSPPVLERFEGGEWRRRADAGFPAGLPRMMLLDVTGQLTGRACKLRLRTNLHVYWDQVFVATGCREVEAPTPRASLSGRGVGPSHTRVALLDVTSAGLRACGIHQEYSPDGKLPTVYAADRFDSVAVDRPAGRLTRFGDVAELLAGRDDRFVIFGPGDLLEVAFDARALPPVPAGWKRSFVLRTAGYCKDRSPFTHTGSTVEPLPFRAMTRYPPDEDRQPRPDATRQREDQRRYHTRE